METVTTLLRITPSLGSYSCGTTCGVTLSNATGIQTQQRCCSSHVSSEGTSTHQWCERPPEIDCPQDGPGLPKDVRQHPRRAFSKLLPLILRPPRGVFLLDAARHEPEVPPEDQCGCQCAHAAQTALRNATSQPGMQEPTVS